MSGIKGNQIYIPIYILSIYRCSMNSNVAIFKWKVHNEKL